MRFLSMIRINESDGQQPSERLMSGMGKLMEEMTRAGALLDTAGLRPTSEGARVKLLRGKISVVDGPFTETKEVIGGYAMIRASSRVEAIQWTRRFLQVHGDEWDIDFEVRQVVEAGSGAGGGACSQVGSEALRIKGHRHIRVEDDGAPSWAQRFSWPNSSSPQQEHGLPQSSTRSFARPAWSPERTRRSTGRRRKGSAASGSRISWWFSASEE